MNNSVIESAKSLLSNRLANRVKERQKGLEIALEVGAHQTIAAIRDPNQCYEDILRVASSEMGLDNFISFILKNDPFWAYNTLSSVPNLGAHREALIKKAAETPESALYTLRFVKDIGSHQQLLEDSAGALAESLGQISGFSLLDQGGYNCAFTMYWMNGGKTQPEANESDEHKWIWSKTIMLGESTSMLCAQFELSNVPLSPGDDVWMYMWVQAGKDIESPLRFTYNPNSANTAMFTCSGTTTIDHLGFNGFQS